MNEVVYRVKHEFKYANRVYRPGDEFVPQGLRNDKTIIEHHCRTEIVVKGSENASKRKPASKSQPGLSSAHAQ